MRSNRLRAAAGGGSSGYSLGNGDRAPTAGRVGNSNGTFANYNSFTGQYDGWTNVINGSNDDHNTQLSFPSGLGFYLAGNSYGSVYVGSNSYVTFGGGSNQYSGLSTSNPSYPKIFVGAADNSYQRVYHRQNTSGGQFYYRIRYEGNNSTSGNLGSPGIVWEMTFFSPSLYGSGQQLVELRIGIHGRDGAGNGQKTLVANSSSSYIGNFDDLQDHSYVFSGNSTGTSWTKHSNAFVSGTDY